MMGSQQTEPYRITDEYFTVAQSLADETAHEGRVRLANIVNRLQALNAATHWLPQGSDEERMVELLTLGVFWNAYGGYAMALDTTPQRLLTFLSRARRRSGLMKTCCDPVRGWFAGIYLYRDGVRKNTPTLFHLGLLVKWLEATGEFDHEAARIKGWCAFFEGQPEKSVPGDLFQVVDFALWFRDRSEVLLAPFTADASRYHAAAHKTRRYQEDAIMRRRSPVDYRLNLIAAVLLNRAYRREFLRASRKQVLVPGCMRNPGPRGCQATACGGNLRCNHCSETCLVAHINDRVAVKGHSLRVVPHASGALPEREAVHAAAEGVAVVGVACALNLIGGGWMVRGKGLPAQCVPLDFCGCKKWRSDPVNTTVNLDELERVLESASPEEVAAGLEENRILAASAA